MHYSVVRGITNGGNVLESISDGFMVDVTPPRIEIDRRYVSDRTVRLSVIYHGMSLTVLYVYHSDSSRYVSDCTVCLSQ